MQITLDDVKPMIAELGFTLPDSVLSLLLSQVNAKSGCLEANYDETTQKLLLIYTVVRLASLSGARKISSQSAPNGASRSFAYDSAGADAIKFIKRDEDVFEHIADDYTLITAV